MAIPDQMVPVAVLIDQDGVEMPIHRDYDHAIIGRYRLDLADVSALVTYLDAVVAEIRRYQDGQAEDADDA